MRPEQKDIFDCSMKQVDYAFRCFDSRRTYEWKVTLGFWLVLALAGRFLYGKHLYAPWYYLVLGSALVVLVHFVWLNGTWKAHESDKIVADTFRAIAVKAMSDAVTNTHFHIPPRVSKTPWRQFLGNWAFRVQISVTLLFVIALILIVKGMLG